MHYGIRNDLDELCALWPKLDLGSGARARMPEQVELAITAFCERPGNRDGRGVTSATVAEVRKILRHMKSAAKRVVKVGTPEARVARKLLKSLHHVRDFEAISERARGYAGTLQRLGKMRARRIAVCEARSICLGKIDALGEVHLERVVSVADMRSIGGQLQLCVAHNDSIGREYHRRLRDNAAEFWQLRSREPLALLEVARRDEGEHGEIIECETAGESEVKLPRSMLLRVVRELDASGDEVAEFDGAGAFWVLRQPRPPTATIEIGLARYRMWRFPDEVIIQGRMEDSRGRRIGWSRFVREAVRPWHSRARGRPKLARRSDGADDATPRIAGSLAWSSRCCGRRALSDEQLQALMLESTEMYNLLAK